MSRRMLVLLVIILGLCWFALVSLGLAGGPSFAGRLDLTAPNFQNLRSRFTARLPVSEMSLVSGDPAVCSLNAARLAVPESEACVFAIQPDAGKTRRLSLTLGGGGQSVGLALTQPNALTLEQALRAGESIDLDVFANDQELVAELTIKDCLVARYVDEADPDLLEGCVLEIKK